METDRVNVSSLYSAAVRRSGLSNKPASGWLASWDWRVVVHLQVECAERCGLAIGYPL
jgi:hypothetical protein